jgi:hypothetical protein
MAMIMTYGAKTFTASRDPVMGGYSTERKWRNPSTRSGSGTLFVYDRQIVNDIKTFTWAAIDPTDLTNLLTFFAATDWKGNRFDLTAPDGELYLAHYWGPDRLEWTPEVLTERDFTIELFIVSHYYYLTDEDGNYLTDEDGNYLLVAAAI